MITDYFEKNGLFDVDIQLAIDLIKEIEKEKVKENAIDYDFWEDDLMECDFVE